MKLHEAIEQLLLEEGKPMKTAEIAAKLNGNQWYRKKDGSSISPGQIHLRTRSPSYSHLFHRDGQVVFLKETRSKSKKPVEMSNLTPSPQLRTPIAAAEVGARQSVNTASDVEVMLMDETRFRLADGIDGIVDNCAGLYCIRIKDAAVLPENLRDELTRRKHNILYIGIASKGLRKRFLGQELRARGHGTFFRSIGAVLEFRPLNGSLREMKNRNLRKKKNRNYKFSREDQAKIIDWINNNLLVNWVPFEGDFKGIESSLITRHLPLINLAKNPGRLAWISKLRHECVRIALEE